MAVFRQYAVYYINKHRDDSVEDFPAIIAHYRWCKSLEDEGLTCYRYKSQVRKYVVDARNQNEARALAFRLLIADIAEGTGYDGKALYFEHDWKVGAIERSQATSGTVSKEDNESLRQTMAHAAENRELARVAKKKRAHRAKRRTIGGKAPAIKNARGEVITTSCKTTKSNAA